MRARTLLVLIVVLLVAGFATLNWSVFAAPTMLSVGFFVFEAPLGLLMLGLVIVITLAFAIYMAYWQASILVEARRHAKELQQQRSLVEQAEASRFTELKSALDVELDQLGRRIDASREALGQEIRDHANSLAAILAEIDHRTGRSGTRPE